MRTRFKRRWIWKRDNITRLLEWFINSPLDDPICLWEDEEDDEEGIDKLLLLLFSIFSILLAFSLSLSFVVIGWGGGGTFLFRSSIIRFCSSNHVLYRISPQSPQYSHHIIKITSINVGYQVEFSFLCHQWDMQVSLEREQNKKKKKKRKMLSFERHLPSRCYSLPCQSDNSYQSSIHYVMSVIHVKSCKVHT